MRFNSLAAARSYASRNIVPCCLALLLATSLGCSSEDAAGGAADAGGDTSQAGAAGSAGSGGGGGGAAGGSGGGVSDASADTQLDTADATTDPFVDAPPRPSVDGPMTIVLYGELDGVDLTGTYDQTTGGGTICGDGFRVERDDGLGGSVVIHWQDDTTSLVPTVGAFNASYGFDFTISRFVRIDDVAKQLTFRAGQTYPGSALAGDVTRSDLAATGKLEAFFTISSAERVVDVNEGIKTGTLYLWVAGSCK